MTQKHVLLVGGTKMVERHLRKAMPQDADLKVMRTMEQVMGYMQKQPVSLLVLGPSMRRSLAVVTTIRRESKDSAIALIVVYRDDQRENVNRHLDGRFTADAYVMQSKVSREIRAAVDKALSASQDSVVTVVEELEELPAEALSDVTGDVTMQAQEAATVMVDVLNVQESPEDALQVLDMIEEFNDEEAGAAENEGEVLGAFDLFEEVEELEDVELIEDIELVEEDMSEELELIEEVELVEEVEFVEEDSLSEDVELIEELGELEEIEVLGGQAESPSAFEPTLIGENLGGAPVVAEDLSLEELDGDVLEETLELLDDDDLIEEVAAELVTVEDGEEEIEELEDDLLVELELDDAEPEEVSSIVEPASSKDEALGWMDTTDVVAVVDLGSEDVDASSATKTPAKRSKKDAATKEPAKRSKKDTATKEPAKRSKKDAATKEVAKRSKKDAATKEPIVARHRHQSSMEVMANNLSELSQIIGRLQEATNEAARLEDENSDLRREVEQFKALLEESAQVESNVEALSSAESARDAAHEELAERQVQFNALREELALVQKQLADAQADQKVAQKAMRSLQRSLDEGQARVKELETKLSEADRRDAGRQELVGAVASELEGLAARLRG